MRKIKKLISALLIAAVLLILVGCEATKEESKPDFEKILISGSGSGITVLKAFKDQFEKENTNIKLEFLPSTGTGDGAKGVYDETLDIGSAARDLTQEEREKYPDLDIKIFAKDAVIIGVNEEVKVDGITSEELKKIYTGEITNWSELGGQDMEIIVLDREESESSKIILREEVLGMDTVITKNAVVMSSADSMNNGIESTQGAIGHTSLGMVNLNPKIIKPLKIDGITPSNKTVLDGTYKMFRTFGVIIKTNKPIEKNQRFIDFIFSKKAKEILSESGFAAVEINN